MKSYSKEELAELIRLHQRWLYDEPGGVRANLSGSDLRGCDLSGSNLRGCDLSGSNLRGCDLSGSDLRGCDLSGSDLRGSNLSGSNGLIYAAASWSGHGECGRQLLAVRIGYKDVYFCGCFKGSADDLQKYIDAGDEHHKASRQRVFDFVRGCMEASK